MPTLIRETNPEVRICGAAHKAIAAAAQRESLEATFAFDRPVLHPEFGPVSVDLIARLTGSDFVRFIAVEGKKTLTDYVLQQADRWVGRTDMIYVAVDTPAKASTREAWRKRIREADFGAIFVSGEVGQIVEPAPKMPVDFPLIEQAFNSGDVELDPPAGSADVRRQTKAVSKWRSVTKYLEGLAPLPATWCQIQRDVPGFKTTTSKKAVDAIDAEDWRGARVDLQRCPYEFYWEPKK
jgi:hypothetical protein